MPTLARLLDEGDTDCLAVRHCLNNSRAAHATGAAAAADADAEEDVLRLPFFLVPRPCAGAVAAHLLNATSAQQRVQDGDHDPRPGGGTADAVRHGKKKRGGKRKRGVTATASASAAAGVEGTQQADRSAASAELLGGGSPGGVGAVLEAGSAWHLQLQAAGDGTDAEGMDREEVEETVAEVKWTMAQLGLCLGPSAP